jgi:hypothetical protein
MCIPGGGSNDAAAQALAEQTKLQKEALQLQKQAIAQEKAAAIPEEDSESGRRAAEDRMRKLLENSGAPGMHRTGDAPVGYRMLTGV